MENVTPMNKLVANVIEEAEQEIYEEMLKKAKSKLKDKLREQKKAQLILNNINREIEEIKLELGFEIV
jgi:flavodoxin